MGKATRDTIFVQRWLWWYRKTERELERGLMTWPHKYEMCIAGCWHIVAKDRLQMHTHKHTHIRTLAQQMRYSAALPPFDGCIILIIIMIDKILFLSSLMTGHPFVCVEVMGKFSYHSWGIIWTKKQETNKLKSREICTWKSRKSVTS